MPDFVGRARRALAHQRASLETRIAHLEVRLAEIDEMSNVLDVVAARQPPPPKAPRIAPDLGGRLPRGDLRQALLDTLDAAPSGLHLSQILAILTSTGRAPHSPTPGNSVHATLYAMRRAGLVENHGRNLWTRIRPKARAR